MNAKKHSWMQFMSGTLEMGRQKKEFLGLTGQACMARYGPYRLICLNRPMGTKDWNDVV